MQSIRMRKKRFLIFALAVTVVLAAATCFVAVNAVPQMNKLGEINSELARVFNDGIDETAFETAKRASFGSRLRGLEDFDSLCLSLVDGVFGGYCALDAYEVLESVKKSECEYFL